MKNLLQHQHSLRFSIIPLILILVWLGAVTYFGHYRPMKSIASEILLNQGFKIRLIQPQNALSLAVSVLRDDPNNLRANVLAGDIYYSAYADFAGGITYYKQSVLIDPANCTNHYLLGYGYESTGQTALSLSEYAVAEELCPEDLTIHKSLANAYYREGNIPRFLNTLYHLIMMVKDPQVKLSWIKTYAEVAQASANYVSLNPGFPLGFGRQYSAAFDSKGILHILALDKDNQNLLIYADSKDGGISWTNHRILYLGSALEGMLVIDDDDVVHVVYGDVGGPLLYTNSKSNFQDIVSVAPDAISRQLAISPNKDLYFAWTDSNNILYYTIMRGALLGQPQVIASDAANPSLALGSNGEAYVSYNSPFFYPDPRGGVFFIRSHDGAWTTPEKVTSDNEWAGAASLQSGPEGNIYLTYIRGQRAQAPSLEYKLYVAENSKWSQPIEINTDALRPHLPTWGPISGRTAPSMLVLNNGYLAIAWRGENAVGKSPVVLSEMVNGLWTTPLVVGDMSSCNIFGCAPTFVPDSRNSKVFGGLSIMWPGAAGPTITNSSSFFDSSAENLASSPPKIADKSEAETAFASGVTSLDSLAPERYSSADLQKPGTLQYSIQLMKSKQVVWSYAWCTTTPQILDNNFASIEVKFTIDGVDIPPSSIQEIEAPQNGLQCRWLYMALSSWPVGEHHLTITTSFLKQIYDGISNYASGDYVKAFVVSVEP
jgi:tetratricopeptide (TPR) repeat protein